MTIKSFLLLTILLIPFRFGYANDFNIPNELVFEYELSYDFTPKPDFLKELFNPGKLITHLRINLPQTILDRQEIFEIKFDPEPNKIFDSNGNNYAEFVFPIDKKNVRVNVQVKGRIFNYDLSTEVKKKENYLIDEPNIALYLRPERMIECDDSLIQKLAKDVKGENEIEIVRNIYFFVISYLDVDLSKIKRVGAAKTAASKKGMCIDYCDLFVAICRAKGIPARVVAGYQIYYDITPKHSWTEVYLKGYGWIPINPAQSNTEPHEYLEWEFYHIRPQFLCFTKIRNDTTLGYNYYYIKYFSTDEKDKHIDKIISFNETIEFKKPLHTIHDSSEETKRTNSIKRYRVRN